MGTEFFPKGFFEDQETEESDDLTKNPTYFPALVTQYEEVLEKIKKEDPIRYKESLEYIKNVFPKMHEELMKTIKTKESKESDSDHVNDAPNNADQRRRLGCILKRLCESEMMLASELKDSQAL